MRKTLGERCVDRALRELGTTSAPYGQPNTSKKVREYLAPCLRDIDHDGDQELLGLTQGNWCAAFVSWCLEAELEPDDDRPHVYRAGVVEIIADAKKLGRWHTVQEVREGTWAPSVGDLLIWDRSDPQKPSTSWWRHVNRLMQYNPRKGALKVIGGNEQRTVRTSTRYLGDPKLLGFVSYSQRTDKPQPTSAEDLALIACFVEAHRKSL